MQLKRPTYEDVDAIVVSYDGIDASHTDGSDPAEALTMDEAATETPAEWWQPTDAAVQAPEKSEGSVQVTEADIARHGARGRTGKLYEVEAFDCSSYPDPLRTFLRDASRTMLAEVADSSTSRALEALSALREAAGDGDDESEEVELRHSLTWGRSNVNVASGGGTSGGKDSSFFEDDDGKDRGRHALPSIAGDCGDGLEVTAVAWGASGSLLAAAFGRRSPDEGHGWCRNSAGGAIVVWDVSSRHFRARAESSPPRPMQTYEHGSHLVCLSAHPSRPAVFAAGSSDGEVLLLDFARSPAQDPSQGQGSSSSLSPLVACSKIGEYFHREPVEALTWIPRRGKREGDEDWLLCSMSGDGNALLWDVVSKLKYPLRGMRLGRRNRHGQNQEDGLSSSWGGSSVLGGTAIAVAPSKFRQDSVFLGTEGGTLLRASLQDDIHDKKPAKIKSCKMKWSSNALYLVSKVHPARKEGLAKDIEAKAKLLKRRGIDSAAVLEGKPNPALLYPVQTDFEYAGHKGQVMSVDTSPFHRNLFLSCGADGRLLLFSSLHREPIEELEPSLSPLDLNSVPILDAKFSRSKPTVIAAGSANGNIYLYMLGSELEHPIETFRPEPHSKNSITSVAFNEKFPSLLAAGDSGGVVTVFHMPKRLNRKSWEDAEVLDHFVQESHT